MKSIVSNLNKFAPKLKRKKKKEKKEKLKYSNLCIWNKNDSNRAFANHRNYEVAHFIECFTVHNFFSMSNLFQNCS